MGIVRAETIARMRGAFRKGLSASRFITDMKAAGLSYRRTDMLADWRNINRLEKKEGLARYVRKGYVPAERSAEIEAWAMSKEYMYKVRSERILYPGAEPEVTFVNIMQDVPRPVEWLEREAWERSFKQSPTFPLEERKFIVYSAIHRAEE